MWLRESPCRFFILPLLLIQALWPIPGFAKKQEPAIHTHQLDRFPDEFFYFDDSDTIILLDGKSHVIQRSKNAGETWETVDDIEKGQALDVLPHPYDNQIAYVIGGDSKHWVTNDQGKSWEKFETEAPMYELPMSFHASDSQKVIIHTRVCRTFLDCQENDYYTTDGFKTAPRLLRRDTKNCLFAHSTPLFEAGADEVHNDRIICIVFGYSFWPKDYRLVVSDNFFKAKGDEFEPNLEGDQRVTGIIKMAVVKGFLVAAAKADRTDELALYVTKNAKDWHRAEFPSDHRLNEDAYTILESTNYSIQVDVMTTTPTNPMGVLFTSNSNGTYFTRNIENTNRNQDGNVDFEKIQGIQGIVLVNVVSNHEEVKRSPRVGKQVQTKISFDDGRTFKSIKYKDEELHLHSVSGISNLGRIFSSPAPGLVMGVGNTGDHLREYTDGNLYVSDDAGLTWILGREKAHKYEFGDQGALLVAIYDEGETNEIAYSLNHGKKWETADLGKQVRAKILTTTPDSTSLKFVLLATADEGHKVESYVFSIDFAGLHERKCDKNDFEQWDARLDEDGKPDCLMGQMQSYRRRRADQDCFIDEEFKDPVPLFTQCNCTPEDFECDYDFVREDQKCVPAGGRLPVPKGQCQNSEDTFTGSSGWRLIPGNKCKRRSVDDEIDGPKKWPCGEFTKPSASGNVTSEKSSFSGSSFEEYYYLERTESSRGEDQTVVMRTDEKETYLTRDHGKTWTQILKGEAITGIYPHDYFNDVVFFLTSGRKVWYSINRGDRIKQFEAPVGGPTHDEGLQPIGFHADSKDVLLWTAAAECSSSDKGRCHSDVYVSKDRGDVWTRIVRYARKCEFIKKEGRAERENLIYCEQYQDESLDNPVQLISSDNWFVDTQPHFPDIIDFATMAEFIIVAAKDQDYLKLDASIDGKTFADAMFPPNFNVPHQKAYTVLESSTHAVFLHVTVENRKDFEYGSIIKSNSNGTFYVLSVNGVNRDESGYVDFEKMLGLQGVALINVVDNIDKVEEGQPKKLKSMITHNDGAVWSLIPPPPKDAEGHDYDCNVEDVENCSLHLHGYTERNDPRSTFSSPSAVGLMMGMGNVGAHLTRKSEGHVFLTPDGGISWRAVKKGNYLWEYGDQGSIIVIVEEQVATNVVYYSRNEGETWIEYKFSEAKMNIVGISTLPSDTSRNFLLWGRDAESESKIATVNLDFTGLTDRQCKLDENNANDPKNDYFLWSPKHPLQKENCLFGHVAQYHRKIPDRDCYNGRSLNKQIHNELKICDCGREDFEWYLDTDVTEERIHADIILSDYNYEAAPDGSCRLVPGLEPADHSRACTDDTTKISYFEPTGYRKIPLSQCQGGRELELTGTELPCPGHDKDFVKLHRGLSGFWLFVVAFLLPAAVATAVGYWVWNNWNEQFGRIKLGAEPGGAFDTSKPWISYPIMVISALVAVAAAVPLLVSSLWRSVRGAWWRGGSGSGRRYTTRGSFARGRGDYAVVDPDEDELLGVEDDEEI